MRFATPKWIEITIIVILIAGLIRIVTLPITNIGSTEYVFSTNLLPQQFQYVKDPVYSDGILKFEDAATNEWQFAIDTDEKVNNNGYKFNGDKIGSFYIEVKDEEVIIYNDNGWQLPAIDLDSIKSE